MDSIISQLAQCFENLPGIGPRQARRFVYALLKKDTDFSSRFAELILALKKEIKKCKSCRRFFKSDGQNSMCGICRDPKRDKSFLLVVEKDVDLDNIESAGFYNGLYYVLGGLVPPIGAKMPEEVKMKELFERVKKDSLGGLKEVILAFGATQEGENTVRYAERVLEPISKKHHIKTSRLGRGLSTGTELEYSDKETIINALKNRQ